MGTANQENERFGRLQARLPALWRSIARSPDFEHAVVVVPSQSVDQEELAKIEGSPFYEERLMFNC